MTQLRKEVIHIVEPFRQKVLSFDSRLLFLEKSYVQLDSKQKDADVETNHKINQMASLTLMNRKKEELTKMMHAIAKKNEERISKIIE